MRAVRIERAGGPEVLEVVDLEQPEPRADEVVVRTEAAGLNFIDTYQRSGQYAVDLPAILGVEGAGTVEQVGAEVTAFAVGDRVAWAGVGSSYAELVAVPADRAVAVPDDLETKFAAAAMLQGMTAHYLCHTTYPISDGETCLVLAGSGGVGHLLVQMAKRRDARVIATVSTDDKERLVRELGADEVIRYADVDLATEARRLTGGAGVDVVYDSVGRDTFEASMDALRPRGYLVLYGQASGPVDPLDPQELNRRGSLFLTRPSLAHYTARREELTWRARDVLGWIADGSIRLHLDRTFPLEEADEAHRYIEGRNTKGKVLLVP